MKAASASDYRKIAQRRVPKFLFDYVDGGSYDEVTLRRNVDELRRVELRQRILRDVSHIDLSTELFGTGYAMPVVLGPIGLAGMFARRGEVQAARAAQQAGVPFTLSTVSACPLDEVADGVGEPIWFQLYMIRDRDFMRSLIEKAQARNCSALVFTVDMPLPGSRYRDYRSGLSGKPGLALQARRIFQAMQRPGWAWDVGVNGRPHHLGNIAPVLGSNTGLEDFLAWMGRNFDPSIDWQALDFIRAHWKGPIIIKGILDVEDAVRAADSGVDGIIVSNHGGRQLDGVPSTTKALPPIAEAVGERLTVLADGGVRSGLDVVRLMALGARGVILGRAWIYALAGGGQAGVSHVLDLIAAEMRVAMSLTGVCRTADIDRSILVERRER